MIYDYVIIGNNINSLMLSYYLIKNNNSVIILEKKSKNDFYFYSKNTIINRNPKYSNNDVNFLNFLNELNVDFKDIGTKININFNLTENFQLNELLIIYFDIISENKYTEIKLSDKINLFSSKTNEFIKYLCKYYNYDYNEIYYYDFIQIINNCLINEFYNIDESVLLNILLEKTQATVIFETEYKNINNNYIETNNNKFEFKKKCIFCISPEKINMSIKYDNIIENKIYNYTFDIQESIIEKNKITYYKNKNNITFYSNFDSLDFIKKDHYFLNNYEKTVVTKRVFNQDIYDEKYIILNNNISIEDNIIRNYKLLNKITNYKIFKIYKNDTIIDIIKLFLVVKLFIK